MATVSLRKLRKQFGKVEAVRGIDLEIADREFVVLVGPSGCGKSTTLRMIAGLEEVSDGEVWIGESLVNEREPKDRDIAMVFQDYALYPHMSVFQNMSFGLEYRGYSRAEIRRRVEEAAGILNIAELLERRPKQLSGGQRQRVAMGRAIVRDPSVFLFDEPLSNLDAKLRVQMRTEIKKLHQRVATTVVYVTHDQVEAMTLADRIVLMRDGEIEQIGSPGEIYNAPRSTYVASFLGSPTMNLVPAEIVDAGNGLAVRIDEVTTWPLLPEQCQRFEAWRGKPVVFGLRPESFAWRAESDGDPKLDAVAEVIEPLGSDTLVFFNVNHTEMAARLPPDSPCAAGEAFSIYPDLRRMHLFDASTGSAL
ncbi:MAG: sn-glycerol-3-phosphate ABC transporter ATP-binding protein UgpC [Pseudomonadota bacterium]